MVSDPMLALANCDRGEDALSGDVLGVPADKFVQSHIRRIHLCFFFGQLLRRVFTGPTLVKHSFRFGSLHLLIFFGFPPCSPRMNPSIDVRPGELGRSCRRLIFIGNFDRFDIFYETLDRPFARFLTFEPLKVRVAFNGALTGG